MRVIPVYLISSLESIKVPVLYFSVTVSWCHQLFQHCFILTKFLLFLPSVVQSTGYMSMNILKKTKQANPKCLSF